MHKRSNGIWHTCIRHNGKRIQKSLETSDRKLAKAIEAKVRTEIVEGTYFEKLIGRNKTFKDMMDKFMEEHAPKVSYSMQKSYSSYLKHLMSFFKSGLIAITPKEISKYKVLRKGEGAMPATTNRELAMLSKAFNLAVNEWEWLKDNPVSRVPKEKENNKRDRWLTQDDECRLIKHCPAWLSDIVVFALNTGLRQDELLSLQWSRVSFEREDMLIDKTKSGKPRAVPLNQIAINILNQRSKAKIRTIKDLVFPTFNGTKILPSNLRRAFYEALRKAGIENFKFHDLRHTFATRLAQRGIDIYKIAKLLGHEDIRMTQRYSHHSPESLRVGVEILEVDFNLTSVGKNT